MAVTSLLDLELAVPDPTELAAFWERRGLRRDDGVLGTIERPSQLRLKEGPYRHVSELRVSCESEFDLDDVATRLDKLGVRSDRRGTTLRCADPLGDHDVVIEVTEPAPLQPPPRRSANQPGRDGRIDRRSSACLGEAPHGPRRVGHVVFGTPDVAASTAFYAEGLGFRISDIVGGGLGCFLRCSPDHHNLLLAPAPIPCLNHYAVEMDDVDAIGLAGMQIRDEGLRGEGRSTAADVSIAGIGRHVVGANLFWYLLDPAGGMFELFADMDQIHDDERWEHETRRDDWDPFTIGAWMPSEAKPDFYLPADIDALARARAAARS